MALDESLAGQRDSFRAVAVTPEQFERVEACFEQLCDLPAEVRNVELERLRTDDPEVMRAVEAMLVEDEGDLSSFERSPGETLDQLQVDTEKNPEWIGEFRVLERLGVGSMGTVFLAEQQEPSRRVAIKVLRSFIIEPGQHSRFRREARILARLSHPGIAQIYQWGSVGEGTDQRPYLVMELIDGEDLMTFVNRYELSRDDRVRLLARVCDAVEHAHKCGVIHRDLKPANVLVLPAESSFAEPLPKVIDFGVAHVSDPDSTLITHQTTEGQVLGTLAYMSPEQVSGEASEVSGQADVWALGVMLFEALTGRLPIELGRLTLPSAVRQLQVKEPSRLEVVDSALRGDLDTIVACALEKSRERRYATAAELAADLRRYLAHEPIAARPPSTAYLLRKYVRRNRVFVGGLVSTLFVLVAGLIATTVLAIQSNRHAQAAEHGEAQALLAVYRASIDAADGTGRRDPLGAAKHLERAPTNLRAWEWNYLAAQFDSMLFEFDCGEQLDKRTHATVSFTADGKLVAGVRRNSTPSTIELVDAQSGEQLLEIEAPGTVTKLKLCREANRVAAVLEQPARLLVWSLEDRASGMHAQLVQERALDFQPSFLTLSERGTYACVSLLNRGHNWSGETLVLDVDEDRVVWDLDRPCTALSLAETADSARLAGWSTKHRSTFVLDSRGTESLPNNHASSHNRWSASCFDPTGRFAAFSSYENSTSTIEIIDLESFEVLTSIRGHHGNAVSPTFSADGEWIAASLGNHDVALWETQTGRMQGAFIGSQGQLAFSPDGKRMAAGTPTGALCWQRQVQGPLTLERDGRYVYQAVFSPDGSLIACCGASKTLRVYDSQTLELLAEFVNPFTGVDGLSFSTDGNRVVVSRYQTSIVWDLDDWSHVIQRKPPSAAVNTTGDLDRDAVWERRFWSIARPGAKSVRRGAINSLASSHSGEFFASSTRTGYSLHDSKTGRLLDDSAAIESPPTQADAIAISNDGALIATSDGLDIKLWETKTHRVLGTLSGHQDTVMTLDFSPDGTRLASGGRDHTLRLWSIADMDELWAGREHAGYIHSVEFSPDGTQIATASGDGSVRLWSARPVKDRERSIRLAKRAKNQLRTRVNEQLRAGIDAQDIAAQLLAEPYQSSAERLSALRSLRVQGETSVPSPEPPISPTSIERSAPPR